MAGTARSDHDPAERWAALEAAHARAGAIDADWQQQARESAVQAQVPIGRAREHLAQARQRTGADALEPLIAAIEQLTEAVEHLAASARIAAKD